MWTERHFERDGAAQRLASSSLPTVVVAQVRAGLANGVTFHAHVDINDGYHPVYTLDFPVTAIHAFYTYLPLVMRNYNPIYLRADDHH